MFTMRVLARAILVPLCFCATLSASASGNTRLSVEGGWGGQLRDGRWAPIFVTASDDKTRNVTLDISWPTAGDFSMHIRQALTIDAHARTFWLLVPVWGWETHEAMFSL